MTLKLARGGESGLLEGIPTLLSGAGCEDVDEVNAEPCVLEYCGNVAACACVGRCVKSGWWCDASVCCPTHVGFDVTPLIPLVSPFSVRFIPLSTYGFAEAAACFEYILYSECGVAPPGFESPDSSPPFWRHAATSSAQNQSALFPSLVRGAIRDRAMPIFENGFLTCALANCSIRCSAGFEHPRLK